MLPLSVAQQAMIQLFQEHMAAELAGDLETTMVDFVLPGVAPTGRKIEMAAVVVVGFDGNRISHEHIYWDQASVLVQAGLLDPTGLPVCGADAARKVLDPRIPARLY